jgi:hypothetical protein
MPDSTVPPTSDQPSSDPQGTRGRNNCRPTDRTEAKLYQMALKRQWPVPAVARQEVVKRLREIVSDPNATRREKTAASRALISADQTSLTALDVAMRAKQIDGLADEVADLRADVAQIKRDQP